MRPDTTDNGLVTVDAREIVNPILAGHEGRSISIPPQPLEQALELVAMLLRTPTTPRPSSNGDGWSCPIVGGRLMITLKAGSDAQTGLRP